MKELGKSDIVSEGVKGGWRRGKDEEKEMW